MKISRSFYHPIKMRAPAVLAAFSALCSAQTVAGQTRTSTFVTSFLTTRITSDGATRLTDVSIAGISSTPKPTCSQPWEPRPNACTGIDEFFHGDRALCRQFGCTTNFDPFGAPSCTGTASKRTCKEDLSDLSVFLCQPLDIVCSCGTGWSPLDGKCVTCPDGHLAGEKWTSPIIGGVKAWECLPEGGFVSTIRCSPGQVQYHGLDLCVPQSKTPSPTLTGRGLPTFITRASATLRPFTRPDWMTRPLTELPLPTEIPIPVTKLKNPPVTRLFPPGLGGGDPPPPDF